MIIPSRQHQLAAVLGISAAVLGSFAALHYYALDLTLSHYDARGHLVVARRIFDSLTPGWRQIGAVWLPLPHVLNAVPVQIDALYRNGASAVAISVLSFAVATAAIGYTVRTVTGSMLGALAAACVFALNPNVLYLQSTPMTEPLLLGLLLPAIALLVDWCAVGPRTAALNLGARRRGAHAVGIVFALACLTRYEAWPVAAVAIAIAAFVLWQRDVPLSAIVDGLRPISLWPAAAVVGFMAFSRVVIGEWFVSSGFFVPDNPARESSAAVLRSLVWGLDALSGHGLVALAGIGLAGLLAVGIRRSGHAPMLVVLSLLATAALPFAAFYSGHPFRIRYMVPLLAAQAMGVGMTVGLWPRLRPLTFAAAAAIVALELRPLEATAPMILEAQWDKPSSLEREAVTECLRERWNGRPILLSMGSLGHYMQELSHEGFAIHDFIHEGNTGLWHRGVQQASAVTELVVVSERPDGRDALVGPARQTPAFLEGFVRVCEGGQVALYQMTKTSH